jgi:hypothetical protein
LITAAAANQKGGNLIQAARAAAAAGHLGHVRLITPIVEPI